MYVADQNALPFSPHHPNQQFFIQGLPNNVPFVPQMPVPPAIAPYYQMLIGQALLVAQSHAGRTVQRTFFFNALSNNGYQNQEFTDLIQATVELADFIMGTRRIDVHTAIKEAADTMNSVMSSNLTRKFPAIRQFMTPEQVTGAEGWIQHFGNLVREIQSWRQRAMQTTASLGYQGNPPPQAAAMGHRTSGPYMGGNFWGAPTTTSHGASSDTFFGGLRSVADANEVNEERALEAVMAPDMPQETTATWSTPVTQPTTESAGDEALLAQTKTDRPWDRVELDAGDVIVPVSLSTWTPTKNDDQPYIMAYHPSEVCPFHGYREGGIVEQVFLPWIKGGPKMEYLKHELRSDMKAAIPKDPNADIEVPLYAQLAHMEPITETMLSLVDPNQERADLPEGTTLTLPVRVTFSNSLEDMVAYGLLELSVVRDELGAEEEILSFCVEQYSDITQQLSVSESDMAWFFSLTSIKTITEFLKAIAEARESDEVSKDLVDLITQRLTDEINKALAFNLQIDLKITNIEEDYAEVSDIFTSVYGEMIVNAWNDNQASLLAKALNVLTGTRLQEYLAKRYDESMIGKLSSRMLVFSDRVAVTFTDWDSSELDIAFIGSGALSEASMPQLHKAVVAMFERTSRSEYPFSNHFLRSHDGELLEFHKGWLGKDFYLVSKF